jgi:hypothetical protein
LAAGYQINFRASMEEYRAYVIRPDGHIVLISAAPTRKRRGGSQKSPLTATPLSFAKPIAS